jgi:drug/metabolite transporter (DMT)-like permease
MLALVLIWGLNFPLIKGALGELPPLVFNGLRFAVAGVLLAAILRRLEGPRPLARADLPGLVVLGALGHAGYQTLFMAGLARTTAGHSSLILAMVPLFVGVMAVAMGLERPAPRIWVGLVVAFAGSVLLIRGRGPLSFGSGTLAGDLLTLAAAVCWAAYTVRSRPYLARYSPLRLTTVTLLLGLPVIAISALPGLVRLDWRAVGAASWAALAFSAVFAVAVGYTIWYTSVQAIGSARTAAFSNLIPVVALASARTLLGEPVGPAQLGGGAVVLLGVWLARKDGTAP